MTKKNIPDSHPISSALSTTDDIYSRKISDASTDGNEEVPANEPRLLDTLAFTGAKSVILEAPYNNHPIDRSDRCRLDRQEKTRRAAAAVQPAHRSSSLPRCAGCHDQHPPDRSAFDGDRAMVVAVATMRMVQMPLHQIVHMIPMCDSFMPTARAMHMILGMSAAAMIRCAASGIARVDLQAVLIDVIAMHMVQVTIVQVVDMAIVLNRRMSAARAMLMGVIGMLVARAHT
ncbi:MULTISPECIES: hypothetical protein [Pseudomonas]|uniref:Uncharacterized protein n=1 Tax=Pseudomonas gingeri TaxID=117681 RepID=A0A7Y7WM69_9PSED|nr:MULTISPECIES: hypothetical protein [Pseudomonas]NWB84026.1 hypothetical protein [Pseudomonas gingeri]